MILWIGQVGETPQRDHESPMQRTDEVQISGVVSFQIIAHRRSQRDITISSPVKFSSIGPAIIKGLLRVWSSGVGALARPRCAMCPSSIRSRTCWGGAFYILPSIYKNLIIEYKEVCLRIPPRGSSRLVAHRQSPGHACLSSAICLSPSPPVETPHRLESPRLLW